MGGGDRETATETARESSRNKGGKRLRETKGPRNQRRELESCGQEPAKGDTQKHREDAMLR